jgi:hypothetical protein
MPLTQKTWTEPRVTVPPPTYQPRCPVCNGPLVELRTTLRCSRCYFTFCEGCCGESEQRMAGHAHS